MAQVGCNGWD